MQQYYDIYTNNKRKGTNKEELVGLKNVESWSENLD